MRRCVILLNTLFIFLLSVSNLQARPFEFGKISADDMDLEYYRAKYPEDFAVMIGDFGSCKFSYNNSTNRFQFQLERTYRIMILDSRGNDLGNVVIPYFSSSRSTENIRRFNANVYNLQGSKVVRERVRARHGYSEHIYGNRSEQKYPLPGIKPGTVFEVTYALVSDFTHELRPWYFQEAYPIEYSEFELRLPSIFRYRNFYRGFVKLDESSSHSEIEHFAFRQTAQGAYGARVDAGRVNVGINTSTFKWKATNVPAFRIEPYTDNFRNYLASMHFEFVMEQWPDQPARNISETWEDVSKYIYKDDDFGGYLANARNRVSSRIPFEVEDEDLKSTLNNAMDALRGLVRWDSRSYMWAVKSPANVISSGVGNSAEINLMLCAMLQNKGIDAKPVLLRTRAAGAIYSDNPTLMFNHVIAGVKDENQKVILMDASQGRLPAGYIPNFAINGRGRLMGEESSEWVQLENPGRFHEKRTYDLVLNPDGTLSGTFDFRYYDEGRIHLDRMMYSRGQDYIFENIGEKLNARLISSDLELSDSSADPTIISGEIEFENFVSSAGDELFLQAMLFETITSHGFQLDEREYPLFFEQKSLTDIVINLKLPKGVAVDELPGSQMLRWGNNLIYEFKSSYDDGMLTLSAQRLIDTHFVQPRFYPQVRNFFSNVVNKNQETIVLKKL